MIYTRYLVRKRKNFCPANSILSILNHLFSRLVRGESELQRLAVAGDEGSELLNLPALDSVLVSQALVRLEECSFRRLTVSSPVFRPMTTVQLVSVFTEIDQTDNLKLKTLNLSNRNYSEVPPEVLSSALVKLEETNIVRCLDSLMSKPEV